jgi:hypothetical protein
MAARLSALLPRLAALTIIWLLATSTITFAASGRSKRVQPPAPAPAAPRASNMLVVPYVRKHAYVFAKGILEDGGFAWRVEGPVHGYAANTVATQTPAPGTKVVDNGLPTVVLRLARNAEYAERGLPENASPDRGTKIVLVSERVEADAPVAANAAVEEEKPDPADATEATPAATSEKDETEMTAAVDGRKPAFVVPGAPREPRDEMPLPQRARLLAERVAAHRKPTPPLVRYWLYQHAWVVAGARFGWYGGAEALRTLISVDRSLQARWGVGARSEAVARAALAEVERKAGR